MFRVWSNLRLLGAVALTAGALTLLLFLPMFTQLDRLLFGVLLLAILVLPWVMMMLSLRGEDLLMMAHANELAELMRRRARFGLVTDKELILYQEQKGTTGLFYRPFVIQIPKGSDEYQQIILMEAGTSLEIEAWVWWLGGDGDKLRFSVCDVTVDRIGTEGVQAHVWNGVWAPAEEAPIELIFRIRRGSRPAFCQ